MEGPIISVDVSNGNSHYMLFEKNNQRLGGVHKINHDVEGFERIKEDVEKLSVKTGNEVCVVYDATGVYTRPLQRYLEKNNIKQYSISPLESARKRKESIHSKKTDKLDPIAISKVYYDKEDMRMHKTEEDKFHRMKQLNRLYEDKLNHLRKYKVTFQNSLSICFPGFLERFQDGYSETAMVILNKYPHPDLLKHKQAETVARYIEKHTCHNQKGAMRYAMKVIDFANKTYPGCEKDDIEVKIMQDLLAKVEIAKKDADDTLQEIIKIAETMDEYYLLLSIDGIGENLASRILAETGDIKRFKTREALIAYAGLDPNISQSGQIKGEHLSISKKGNKRLRCLLYLAVTCNIRVKKENAITHFYQKKRQQSNPLNSKAAKIACTAKLLKIIYGMCKSNAIFQR